VTALPIFETKITCQNWFNKIRFRSFFDSLRARDLLVKKRYLRARAVDRHLTFNAEKATFEPRAVIVVSRHHNVNLSVDSINQTM
jgi:hypothetical protein